MNQVDNPMFYYLGVAADIVIVNILCLICCLPVVTIGASVAASYKVMQNMVMGDESSVVKSFYVAFRNNFRQATCSFLCFAALFLGLLCQGLLIYVYFSGIPAILMFILLGITFMLLLVLESHIRSLMVRYRNTLREHLHNAILLMTVHPVRSAIIMIIRFLPTVIWAVAPLFFYRTMIIYAFIGISGAGLLESLLIKGVFLELEACTGDECAN